MKFILLINVKNCWHFNIVSRIDINKLRVSKQEDLYFQVNIQVSFYEQLKFYAQLS